MHTKPQLELAGRSYASVMQYTTPTSDPFKHVRGIYFLF